MKVSSFLSLLIFSTLLTYAQPSNTNVSNGLLFDGEPFLAINPTNNQNLIAAWIGVKFINGAFTNVIKTKSSFDGGNSWSIGNHLPHFNPNYGSADPSIVFGSNGTAYICYIDFREAPDSGGVFVARSSNGGLNWDTPTLAIDMYDSPSQKPIDRPWMVIDNSATSSNGTLYITSMPPSFVSPPNRPVYKVSTDGGFTWTALANLDGAGYLTGNSIGQPMATPATTIDGKFLAIYPSYVTSQNVYPAYYLAKSANQGQSFTYTTVYSGVPGSSNTNFKKGYLLKTDPSNPNKMIFLIPNAINGDSDIDALHSNDGGQSWSLRVRVNDDALGNGKAQDMVWADYNLNGDLIVTWRDRRDAGVNDFWGAGYDFYYAKSSDNGVTFSQNQKLSSQFIPFDSLIANSGNDFMSCVFSGDTLYAIWGDTRNDKMNIYFAKTIVSTNTTISISEISGNKPPWTFYPNPVKEVFYLDVQPEWIGKDYAVYDAAGKCMVKETMDTLQTQITVKNWPKGIYSLVIGNEMRKMLKE